MDWNGGMDYGILYTVEGTNAHCVGHLLIFRKEWELRVCWVSPGGMTLLFTGHLACFTMSFRTLLSRSPTKVTDLQWKREQTHLGTETFLLMTGISSFSGQFLSTLEMS